MPATVAERLLLSASAPVTACSLHPLDGRFVLGSDPPCAVRSPSRYLTEEPEYCPTLTFSSGACRDDKRVADPV